MVIYLFYLVLTVLGLILVKLDKNEMLIQFQFGTLNISIGLLTIIGMVCYVGSFLIFMGIIQRNALSFIYPILNGTVTILTFIAGIIIFGESLSYQKVLGLLIIVAGIFLINYEG